MNFNELFICHLQTNLLQNNSFRSSAFIKKLTIDRLSVVSERIRATASMPYEQAERTSQRAIRLIASGGAH